ncbi:MAG TPA: PH domain-containing protein [Stellaceae bacterium]
MTYAEKTVQPGEGIRFVSRVHWIVYLRGLVFIVLGIIVAVAIQASGLGTTSGLTSAGGFNIPALVAVAAGLAIGGLSLIEAWWRRYTTEVTVTDTRIIYKRGFIRRHSFEMNMNKVESVHVNQSVFGRLFDYGDIVIRGTGSSFEPLRQIARPIEFRSFVTAG